MEIIGPENEYCIDEKVSSGKSISAQAMEIVKIRDAIVHLAIYHRDTCDLELLGMAVSSLGRRLSRLMDGVA